MFMAWLTFYIPPENERKTWSMVGRWVFLGRPPGTDRCQCSWPLFVWWDSTFEVYHMVSSPPGTWFLGASLQILLCIMAFQEQTISWQLVSCFLGVVALSCFWFRYLKIRIPSYLSILSSSDSVVVSNILNVQPYLGRWSILTNVFQTGWNHQLDEC